MKILHFLTAYAWRGYHAWALRELQARNAAHPDIPEIVCTIARCNDRIAALWRTCAAS